MNENEFEYSIRDDYEFRLCTAIDDIEKNPERVPAVYVRERFGSRQEYVILGAEFLPEDEREQSYLTQTYYVSSESSTLNSVIFIDWQTFFADGRSEKETNLKFDAFSLRLYPESPDELDCNLSTSETGRYTDHFSTLNCCLAENECSEVLAYLHVEDYESGKCRRTVDFFRDEIEKAAAENPKIIPVLQDFRAFLMENGFEFGGSLPETKLK